MANVKIILIVDTEEITKKNPEKYCVFVDNTRNPAILPPEEYITRIDAGQIIEWSGVARNPGSCDCVSIDSISIEKRSGNVDLFGTPVLIGSAGVIQATILAHETEGREESYTLRFTVIKNQDGSTESYRIDPKLGVNN
ncbi:MAG: hypothetical protein KDC80_30690 [Saprospiraceae bacterium]|nr:hypothetical protein [Saprospiraceae bacterium]